MFDFIHCNICINNSNKNDFYIMLEYTTLYVNHLFVDLNGKFILITLLRRRSMKIYNYSGYIYIITALKHYTNSYDKTILFVTATETTQIYQLLVKKKDTDLVRNYPINAL